ncbi:MAG: hypothetical protein ACRESZ_18695 [Methylococcales bacterium]
MISTEPVFADAPLPIAAFSELVVVDALITVDFFTSEPLTLIEPVFADAFLPIAAFNELVVVAALISVDFSIFEPSAMAIPETKTKANAIAAVNFVFITCYPVVLLSANTVYSITSPSQVNYSRSLGDLFTAHEITLL